MSKTVQARLLFIKYFNPITIAQALAWAFFAQRENRLYF